MANVQSPPGLLSVYEVFNAIGIHQLNKEIKVRGFSTENQSKLKNPEDDYRMKYTLYDADNLSELEAKLKKSKFLTEISMYIIEVTVDREGHNRLLKINKKKCMNLEPNLDFIDTYKVMHSLRQLLSEKYLEAYVQHDYAYRKMPPGFWHYDHNWYRLLADGRLCDDSPTAGDTVVGSVYFKKEDVEHCLSINIDRQPSSPHNPQPFLIGNSQSLINLETYSTPWLQVLGAIYDEYGQDKLAQVAKISIETFITEYIKKHELDIAQSDVPFLAKFMRLAEQKDGKKYHAEQKLKKLHNS